MKDITSLRDLSFDLDDYFIRFIPPSQLHRLPQWMSRFLGHRSSPHRDVGNVLVWFWSLVGAFGAIALIAEIFKASEQIQRFDPPVIFASLVCSLTTQYLSYSSGLICSTVC